MLSINNLCFSYRQQPVYRQLNATIEAAGIYGMFGRNGSGKSTLLKLMSGLLSADEGEISILGFNPRARKPAFLNQIYLLPEEFHLPNLTVDKLALTQAPFYPNFNIDLYHHYVDTFAVPKDKRFSSMSLGQKKKATIALALATLTPILLMDEPTNGLDITSRDQFKQFMASPAQQERVTLISTHQAHDLEKIVDYIWFIDEGKLLLSSPIAELNASLAMGVDKNNDLAATDVIYNEHIGQQTFWISANASPHSSEINIEMLYKALSTDKSAIIAAINDYRVRSQELA